MKLDLQKDELTIRSFIQNRIRDFGAGENLGPGDGSDPVALITLGYYLEQTGYFAFVFDTRQDADNDGEWTGYIENDTNVLPFPKWCQAFEKHCEGGSVEVVLPGGITRTLDDSDDNASVATLFGEMLRDTMLSLRDDGTTAKLPLAPDAFFIVEEFDGNYGWPAYDERKTLGRLTKK